MARMPVAPRYHHQQPQNPWLLLQLKPALPPREPSCWERPKAPEVFTLAARHRATSISCANNEMRHLERRENTTTGNRLCRATGECLSQERREIFQDRAQFSIGRIFGLVRCARYHGEEVRVGTAIESALRQATVFACGLPPVLFCHRTLDNQSG